MVLNKKVILVVTLFVFILILVLTFKYGYMPFGNNSVEEVPLSQQEFIESVQAPTYPVEASKNIFVKQLAQPQSPEEDALKSEKLKRDFIDSYNLER